VFPDLILAGTTEGHEFGGDMVLIFRQKIRRGNGKSAVHEREWQTSQSSCPLKEETTKSMNALNLTGTIRRDVW